MAARGGAEVHDDGHEDRYPTRLTVGAWKGRYGSVLLVGPCSLFYGLLDSSDGRHGPRELTPDLVTADRSGKGVAFSTSAFLQGVGSLVVF